ncbi:MAG: FecCD family ABC transporter permease, partial [Methanobacterium sp.]
MFKLNIRNKVASHEISITVLMIIPLIILFFASFLVGRYPISPNEVLMAFGSKLFFMNSNLPATVNTIIFDIRLPRILAAMIIGASLSIAGASFQGLFQNPLVSPDKLGVSAGAGFGASLAILFSAGLFMIQFSAFAFGLIAVGLTYFLGRSFKGTSMLTLVLCGIAIASLFSALLSLIKYVADP